MELLKALLFGILEGITEWLPVSSTGHLILLDRFLSLNVEMGSGAEAARFAELFRETFDVVVQLGAIGAVTVRYFDRLFPFLSRTPRCGATRNHAPHYGKKTLGLYGKLVLSGIPAALVGTLGDRLLAHFTGRDLDGLLYRVPVVAVMLILYGVLFLIPDGKLPCLAAKRDAIRTAEDVSPITAFLIGCFQALSIVPGTSRSGATILGGRMLGLSRAAATEYSFFLAVPTMAGAALLKTLKFGSFVAEHSVSVPIEAYRVLTVGALSAFVVSLLAIDFLMSTVRKHSFRAFGVYRILLGAAVLLFAR
ncbi:MAG: undecaprenyl-diphosphate phosphatase [Clostridia bacterium]|nr:undecaprenyl-diphosphate phosphatase [Clostridia bacterium]